MKKMYRILFIFLSWNALEAKGDFMAIAREEVPVEKKWNVEALYASNGNWMQDFEKIRGAASAPRWPDLQAYRGHLAKSPAKISEFLDGYFQLSRRLEKLYTYAHLRMDEDLGNDAAKKNFGLVSSLINDFQVECSWVEPELLSIGKKEFDAMLKDPKLKEYRFYLEKIGRMRPHTLNSEMEELVAMTGKALAAPHKAFGALNDADLKFEPAKTKDGELKDLTSGTYSVYLRSEDRSLRKSAFENLHRGFAAYENTICELLQGEVQGHLFMARAKKFEDCRSAALFPNQVDPAVYDRLIASIHEHLGALHEYIQLRKEIMGVDELHPYDLYVPLVKEIQVEIPYAEAEKLVVESVAPLGRAYQDALKKGIFEDRWVDAFENLRKRSGAYSSGCYDSMPYILMNYHGNLNDVLTLAHEAGHSMHSYLSHEKQPYVYAQYPIFVAEVASTFNEQLLLQRLFQTMKGKKEKAYLINYEIEAIRGTIFRQTLFAEFELQLHRWAEEGTPLTPTLLKEFYLSLNRMYYGPDLTLDGGLESEWARIPHFYYDFYVYQYATGLSAALDLFEKVSKDSSAKDRYLEFLSSGGSKYPLDLLKLAGVDLRTSAPIEAAMKRFAYLVGELKGLLSNEKK